MLRRIVPSAHRPVLANRAFRRLILGFAVSYLGDGMSFVAVAWLAIELAPQATAGLWVGGAAAEGARVHLPDGRTDAGGAYMRSEAGSVLRKTSHV